MNAFSNTKNIRSVVFLSCMFTVVIGQNQACQQPITSGESSNLQVQPLLNQLGTGVLLPQLRVVQVELDSLETELINHQASLDDESKSSVQSQWKEVMSAWQQIEIMQFGPLGSSLNFIAGEDLRDEIYSWPTTNRCRVDQKTVTGEFSEDNFFTNNLVHSYGLDALEHLLFSGLEAACPPQISPVSDGLWDSIGPDQIIVNRIEFALRLTNDLQESTKKIIHRWEPAEENFVEVFTQGSAPYSSEQDSLNEVYHALFYLETHTKDKKLAHPLGLKDCTDEYCVDDLEGILSSSSLESIISNLIGFQQTFTGGTGFGFDDLLVNLGHPDLSEQILEYTQDAIDKGRSLRLPLKEGIIEDRDAVLELHESISNVTSILKNELSIVLSLQVPTEAAGDND